MNEKEKEKKKMEMKVMVEMEMEMEEEEKEKKRKGNEHCFILFYPITCLYAYIFSLCLLFHRKSKHTLHVD